MTFDEIAQLVPHGLPRSADEYRAWWANDYTHSHARSWLAAGWEVATVDFKGRRVTFRKTPFPRRFAP